MAHSRTSAGESVRIEVEPKRVEQTSPATFDDPGKRFMSR
jgi:hypothetical protein